MGPHCSHRGKHPHPSSVVLTLSINFINVYANDFAETIWRKMKTKDSMYQILGLPVHVYSATGLHLVAILWTVTPQAPLSVEFFRQEY